MVSITGFERVALAGEGDPADQLARALIGEGVEHRVDHVALGGEALAAAGDRGGDRGRDGVRDILGQRAVEPGDRAEMMEQIGVGAADLGRDRLQGDRGGALLEQQRARGGDRGGAAFLLASGVYGSVTLLTFMSANGHVPCSSLGVCSMTAASVTHRRDARRPDHHPARPPLRARRCDAARWWHGGRVRGDRASTMRCRRPSRWARRSSSRACARSATGADPSWPRTSRLSPPRK